MKSEKKARRAIIHSLKQSLMKASWWDEVQDDVKTRLDWLADRVVEVGPLFASTYMSLFRWEFERRRLEGETATNPMAAYLSALLGMRISQEAYECGLLPTRAILNLYDYLRPNDADVAACLMFCNKVEILEKSGIIERKDEELKTSSAEMSKILLKTEKKNTAKKIEETLTWEDQTEPE